MSIGRSASGQAAPGQRAGAGRRPGRDSLVLAIACVAQFMVVLDVSIVTVALPSIGRDLHYTASGLQWVVNAYVLTFAGFLLLGGRAADIFGQKKVFLIGLAVFTGASLAAGFAPSDTFLTAARAIQGLGGVLVTELSWRWVFFINVPIGGALALMALTFLPEHKRSEDRRSLDVVGAVLVTAGLTAAVYAIVNTTSYAWGSARTLLTLAAAAVLLVAFFVVETSVVAKPLVPMRFFRSKTASGANLV